MRITFVTDSDDCEARPVEQVGSMWKLSLLVAFVGLSAICSMPIIAIAQGTAHEHLDAYESSILPTIEKSHIRGTVIRTIGGDVNFKNTPRVAQLEFEIWWRDGDIDINVEEYPFYDGLLRDISDADGPFGNRMIIDERFKMVQQNVLGQTPRSLGYSEQPEKFRNMSSVERVPGVLEGYIRGDIGLSIAEIMRNADRVPLTLKDGMDRVEGKLTYVLEAESQNGTYRLWLDPKSGHSPVKILVQKKGNDLYFGRAVDTPVEIRQQPGAKYPTGTKSSVTVTVDNISTSQMGPHWIPTSSRVKEEIKYENGESYFFEYLYDRNEINLDPDFSNSGAFQLDLPNGTPVFLMRQDVETGLKYEWRSGKVVSQFNLRLVWDIEKEMLDYLLRDSAEPGEDYIALTGRAQPK